MKICLITGKGAGFDTGRLSGPSRIAWELGKKLSLENQVFFIHLGDKNTVSKVNGVVKICIKFGPTTFVRMLKLLYKIKPEVIHGHGSLNLTLLLVALKKILRYKTVQTFTDFKKNITNNYLFLNLLDNVIVQTEFAQKELLKRGVKSNLLSKITYGVEERFNQGKSNKSIRKLGQKIVMYYGDARHERGFHLVLNAANKLNPNIIMLVCIRDFLKGYDRKLLSKKLTNVRFMCVEDYPCSIQDIIASVDLVVLPFVHNTLEPPLTLMEVSSARKNLITSNIGGNSEIVGKDAIMLKNLSGEALASAINQNFASNKSNIKIPPKMIYSWDETCNQITGVYLK